jgi:putative ABC transport system substrate-binding protein
MVLVGTALSAQEPAPDRIYRLGVLFYDTPEDRAPMLQALREGLRERGYADGALRLDVHYALHNDQLLAKAANELAGSNADVIVTAGTLPTLAAFKATKTRPIVMVGVGDPVARGFVNSMEHPQGNVTGSSDAVPNANALRFAAIQEAMPFARRVAFVANSQFTPRGPVFAAAQDVGLTLTWIDASTPADVDAVCASLAIAPPDAVVVVPNPASFAARHRLAACALEKRIAVVFGWREFMDAPALMAVGASLTDLYRTAAEPIDRILKGAAPGEIPVALPKFALVVNRETARTLGLALPQSLLLRADRVIE